MLTIINDIATEKKTPFGKLKVFSGKTSENSVHRIFLKIDPLEALVNKPFEINCLLKDLNVLQEVRNRIKKQI